MSARSWGTVVVAAGAFAIACGSFGAADDDEVTPAPDHDASSADAPGSDAPNGDGSADVGLDVIADVIGDAKPTYSVGSVNCGTATCEQCCYGGDTAMCQPKFNACTGTMVNCDQTEDCSAADICCHDATSNKTECRSTDGCSGIGQSKVCRTASDCSGVPCLASSVPGLSTCAPK